MAGFRTGVAALALVVASALIAGLAWNLVETQENGRATLRDGLERRAALTAKLIGGAFFASNTPENGRANFGGSERSLRAAVAAQAAAARGQHVLVLDAGGHVLAASSAELERDRKLLDRHPHLRVALRGAPVLSDAFRDDRGRLVVEIAVPFRTSSGRRVLAGTGSIDLVRNFAQGFFATASATPGAQGYLLDGAGRTLSASGAGAGAPPPVPDPRLTAALRRETTGAYGDRVFVSARVASSDWRVVLSVPTDRLYRSVDGGPSDAAWQLFAAFAAAVIALLALGFLGMRTARRLAAATERERAAQELAHQRLHDALTGLPNRTLFHDRARCAAESGRRRGGPVGLVFLDIDDFKRINDSLGHEAGDAVLREVAARLGRSVRAVDTVSRFGGDEFVVLCEDVTDPQQLVCRIRDGLAGPVLVRGREVPVTLSIGMALQQGPDDARTAGELLRDADAAMYRAKQLGRGRFEIFDSAIHHQTLTRLDDEVALRRAIDEQELVVHYQPIVRLPDGGWHGVEALVRWARPETGELVPPGDFIPLAEETGLIGELGDWVLRTAIREVGDWVRRGLVAEGFKLSVNVSARQLADPLLAQAVSEALTGWDLPARSLCLEITESAVMLDREVAERTLDRLHALGVRLALDDFGVGYSSLGQLARTLPISVLKLDRSFVAGMTAPRDRVIVAAAAALGNALGLVSVAEGVECADQAAELTQMGFPFAQGFYFGTPMAAGRIVELLAGAASAPAS